LSGKAVYDINAFLTRIGDVAVRFSNLEFAVSLILARLIDTSQHSIAGEFVADTLSLSEKLRIIKRVAPLRYCHKEALRNELLELCNAIEKMKNIRNLFIHGSWNFEAKYLEEGKVACLDMRWKAEKNLKQWLRTSEQTFSLKDFGDLCSSLGKLTSKAFELKQGLRSEDMMPHAAKRKDTHESSGA
jgi:hypothetical protein